MQLRQRWLLTASFAVTACSAAACSSGGGSAADATLPPMRTTTSAPSASTASTVPTPTSSDGEVASLPVTLVAVTLVPLTLPPTTLPPTTPAPSTLPPASTLPLASTTIASTSTLPGVAPTTYRIVVGDTLYGIARAFNTTLEDLLAVNDPSISDMIHDGDVIKLPKGARPITADDVASVRYTVRSGDTILAIAREHDVIPAQLLALNRKLDDPTALVVGEVLLIPRF